MLLLKVQRAGAVSKSGETSADMLHFVPNSEQSLEARIRHLFHS